MKTFKKFILFIHRWLGLITGIVVFILGVTGCLFVFQHEISQWTRHDLLYVDAPQEQTLPIKALQKKARKALGVEYLPYGLTTYKNPKHTWSVMYYKGGGDSWTYFGTIKDYRTLYINPYTGEVAGIVNEEKDFFQIVKAIHWSLLLATPIGQPIVSWCTIIFIILLISGLILWWPKRWSKRHRKKSFTIRWKGSWRRINYDLHNVLGFYFLLITLILALTGLYWYLPKLLNLNGSGGVSNNTEPKVASVEEEVTKPLQMAYIKAWNRFPQASSITITAPVDSTGVIRAGIQPDGDTYYRYSSLSFNQQTGKIINKNLYREKSTGEKLLAMNYDIHVGAIGGLAGKIIAFFASLFSASLPVTGFIYWYDRERRKWRRKKTKKMTKRKDPKKKDAANKRKAKDKVTA